MNKEATNTGEIKLTAEESVRLKKTLAAYAEPRDGYVHGPAKDWLKIISDKLAQAQEEDK